jgi:hypothetical protein
MESIVSNQAMDWITDGTINKTVVTEKKVNPGDPTVLVAEISLTGGHMDGAYKTVEAKEKIGAGTSAERTIIITVTGKVKDPKAKTAEEAYEIEYTGSVNDPIPAAPMPKDLANFPLITTVRPKVNAGKPVKLDKTAFPTKWNAKLIETMIVAAVGDARKQTAPGVVWTPNPKDPNAGKFQATENGVIISGKWAFDAKAGTLSVEEAYPIK